MRNRPIACQPPLDPFAPIPRQDGGAAPIAREALATPILIIEDEPIIGWMLESLFEDMGFETIMLASSAEDAIAAARATAPGLIVSDINLGVGLDGIEVVSEIVGGKATPVVFVTGYADDDARSRVGRKLPGAMVLPKPIQPAELRAAVADALRSPTPH